MLIASFGPLRKPVAQKEAETTALYIQVLSCPEISNGSLVNGALVWALALPKLKGSDVWAPNRGPY